MLDSLRRAILSKQNKSGLKVAVIGTGYVGLTTGACFARLGHEVICADILPEKVDKLSNGEIPILEEGMEDLVQEGINSGRLKFVLGAANAARDCHYAFMCLPTPQGEDGSADLTYLLNAAKEIAEVLPSGAIVVNKSTVPVGSAETVAGVIGRDDVVVASNPEFLREGTSVYDFFNPDRIVIGAPTDKTGEKVALLYKDIDAPKLIVNTATAELIKYASNSFLAAKLSFANSISNLCEAVGANAHEVLAGMGYDTRIGKKFLNPGPGWGGSCFPKDVFALIRMSESSGYDFDLLKAVIETNEVQIALMSDKAKKLLKGKIAGAQIAVWGLTFKAGTDDIRESPAIKIINSFIEAGAKVKAYDPGTSKPIKGVKMAKDALSACEGSDLLVVLTEWPEFGEISLVEVGERLSAKRLLDTRNIVDVNVLDALDFEYQSVGYGESAKKDKISTNKTVFKKPAKPQDQLSAKL
jgi:UDPglucose 6-dehydrogenase